MSDNTELITALANILTIPPPATEADHWLYDRILHDRVVAAQSALDSVLAGVTPETAAAALRQRMRELPITYRTYEPPDTPGTPREVIAHGLGIDLHIPAAPDGES